MQTYTTHFMYGTWLVLSHKTGQVVASVANRKVAVAIANMLNNRASSANKQTA